MFLGFGFCYIFDLNLCKFCNNKYTCLRYWKFYNLQVSKEQKIKGTVKYELFTTTLDKFDRVLKIYSDFTHFITSSIP